MPEECHPSISVDRIDPRGTIFFDVRTSDCDDSVGRFEYEYTYTDEDDVRRTLRSSTYWTRTNGQSSFSKVETINLADGQVLEDARVVQSTINCDCHDKDSASEEGDEWKFDPSVVDIINLAEEMYKRITRERLMELFQWSVRTWSIESINVIGGSAEYASNPDPGIRTFTEREQTSIVNDTDIKRSYDQTITIETRVGVSATMNTVLVNASDVNIGVDASGLTGSGSDRYSLSVTKTEVNNWETKRTEVDSRSWSVGPRMKLTITFSVEKRLDGLDFDAVVLSDGIVYVEYGSEKVKIVHRWTFAQVWPNQQDRIVRLKGKLFNVSVTKKDLTFTEEPLRRGYRRQPNQIYNGLLRVFYSDGRPYRLSKLRKEMPELWDKLIASAHRLNSRPGKEDPYPIVVFLSGSEDVDSE